MKKNVVFVNLLWRFFERCGAQGVTLILSIILARLLDPDVYGTIALVTVFTTILQVFVDSGLGNALIQKKEADDVDFSSVFYCNIVVCLLLYGLMFVAAPFIAGFYEMPELTNVIRVLSLIIVISGLKNVQMAYVSRHLLFKRFFFATLGGTLGAAALGIWMAYSGYGIWALVAQELFNTFAGTCILWFTVKWRPRKLFSWKRLKELYSFGWKLLVSSLINHVYNNIRQLIIGKMYSSSDLAYFNKGKQFPNAFVSNIDSSIDSVLFPVLSEEQDDRTRVKAMTRRSIKTSVFIMAPLLMGLAAVAEPFVHLLLTSKWMPCVVYMRIFCVSFMFQPIHTANLNAIKAMGRSDLFLKIDIAKRVMGLIILFSTIWFGPVIMALSLLLSNIVSQIILSWPNKKLLNYSYLDQLKDILPSIFLAVFMGACVYAVQFLGLSDWLTLLIQLPLGIFIYVAGSKLFHLEIFGYIIEVVKGHFPKKKKEV